MAALPPFHPVKLLLSSIQRPRTADEPVAPNVEPQGTVRCSRHADPFALPDFLGRLTVGSEPQRLARPRSIPSSRRLIPKAALEEERPVSRGHAAIGVTREVTYGIRLGLDDTATRHALSERPHQHFANRKPSKLLGIDRQLRSVRHARGRVQLDVIRRTRMTRYRC